MTERRTMGRGLAALIPSAPAAAVDIRDIARQGVGQVAPTASDRSSAAEPPSGHSDAHAVYREVDVGLLHPNPRQPREVFDEEALAELAHSIGELGLLQPIVVRIPEGQRDDEPIRYEIIAGERRWRASQLAGLSIVPIIIRHTSDNALLTEALLENLHRADLNPLEEAAAYSQLLEDFGCTQEQLARQLGRSRPQVANTIRLLRLPPAVQRRVAAGVLSAGHARALLSLADETRMEALATRIVAEGLSVRAVEEIVTVGGAEVAAGGGRTATRRRSARPVPVEVDEVAHRLGDRFDTRVQITLGPKKGRISIDFASIDDLARIVALIEGRSWDDTDLTA